MVTRRDVLGLFASLGALGALAGCSVTKTGSDPAPTSPASTPSPTPTVPAGQPLPAGLINVLVLGSDSRSNDLVKDSRTDVICLVQLTPERTHLNLVSVPRDTLVTLPNGGRGKVNEGFVQNGPKGMADTVSRLLGGITVHYTLVTGFSNFISISEQLGGFTVQNRIASNTAGPKYPVGPITMSGNIALAYVRERYGLPNGDLDRTERARAALTGLMLRIGTLIRENDLKFADKVLPGLWEKILPGGGVSMDHALGLFKTVKNLTAESVSSTMVPIAAFDSYNGGSVDVVNQGKLNELIAALKAGDLSGYVAKYGMDTTPR